MTIIDIRTTVAVVAEDRGRRDELYAAIISRDELRLVGPSMASPDVLVVSVEDVEDGLPARLHGLRRPEAAAAPRIVLIVGDAAEIDLDAVAPSLDRGVRAVVQRSCATGETLVRLVSSAIADEIVLPATLLHQLIGRSVRPTYPEQPRPSRIEGCSERETTVLRLLASGLSTNEIAHQLSYSPRTIKTIVHDLNLRFDLRNRAHAVAFAVRCGLI